jgi:hypothetical protein
MTINVVKLINLGLPYNLANEVKSQVDADVAAQRDIGVVQSAVAATGTTISGALATTGDCVTVGSTSNSSNDGVKLRVPSATAPVQVIINRHATSSVKVYPCNDLSFIDGVARAGSVLLSSGQSAEFWATVPAGTVVGSTTQYAFAGRY